MISLRTITSKLLLAGFCVLVAVLPSRAARDLTAAPVSTSGYEFIVLEVKRCIYCKLFRRDVLPTYKATTRSKIVPMRFIDLDHGSLAAFQLAGPVETVPTVVLLQGHREVGRVSGHVGPETFLHIVNRLLSEAP